MVYVRVSVVHKNMPYDGVQVYIRNSSREIVVPRVKSKNVVPTNFPRQTSLSSTKLTFKVKIQGCTTIFGIASNDMILISFFFFAGTKREPLNKGQLWPIIKFSFVPSYNVLPHVTI